LFASVCGDEFAVEVWDIDTGKITATLPKANVPIAMSADNKTVVTSSGNADAPISVWTWQPAGERHL
jgi:WD40 repeat protein